MPQCMQILHSSDTLLSGAATGGNAVAYGTTTHTTSSPVLNDNRRDEEVNASNNETHKEVEMT
jgi:hypothetical protein